MKKLFVVMFIVLLFVSCMSTDDLENISDGENTPPVITGYTLTPEFPAENTDATLSIQATDEDGDSLSYSFTVSSNDINVTGSGATVSLHVSTSNRRIVQVQVSDGRGGKMALDIYVNNKVPTISSLSMLPDPLEKTSNFW